MNEGNTYMKKEDEFYADFLNLTPPIANQEFNFNGINNPLYGKKEETLQQQYQQVQQQNPHDLQQHSQMSFYSQTSVQYESPPPAPISAIAPQFPLQLPTGNGSIEAQQLPTFNVNQDLDDFFNSNTRQIGNRQDLNVYTNSPTTNTSTMTTPMDEIASQLNSTSQFANSLHQDLLSPSNFEYLSTGTRSHSNSFYSDYSSNPNSPFLDAASHISYEGSDYSPLPDNASQLDLRFNLNLNDTGVQEADYNQYGGELTYVDSKLNRLTEDNLTNINNNNNITRTHSNVIISIQEPPEVTAAKTPSLFSNSSHSSKNNSPRNRSRANTNDRVFGDNLLPSDGYNNFMSPAGSPSSQISEHDLLKPEDYNNMRLGRQLSHSSKSQHSRERSRSADSRKSNVSTSREKMLELASPNQSNKRVQKHPSVYACHLCDKRFTRPYNLKSHLRTHTDERPFICTVCGKAFARQHDRKRHEDLHSGEKKFQCKGFLKNGTPYGCGRKFARADALRRHFQTEAGKECIRMLIEEAAGEQRNDKDTIMNEINQQQESMKQFGGGGDDDDDDDIDDDDEDMVSPKFTIPQVSISPPENSTSSKMGHIDNRIER